MIDTAEALAPVLAGCAPAPARSRSTPSARPATATPSAPTWCSCAARARRTALVDPIAFDDLSPLAEVLDGPEWILHAATQDLPCLTEIGLRPRRLFDTELAARLLNLPRVGLAWLVEDLLGGRLAKEHSAVDWSTRPLPRPWLEYAALDVEVLVELRGLLAAQLVESGKREWADQEFEALLSFTGPPPRIDPWRRTSGMHRVRGRRALAVVRELWQARDRLAADLDVTPGRVLTDAAIVEAARQLPAGRAALRALPGMRHRQARKHLETWEDAIARAVALPDERAPAGVGPYGRPAAASGLAGPRPGRGGPARRLPHRRRGAVRRAPGAGREPDRPRRRPPARVGAARPAVGRGGGGRADGQRGQAVAGRARPPRDSVRRSALPPARLGKPDHTVTRGAPACSPTS